MSDYMTEMMSNERIEFFKNLYEDNTFVLELLGFVETLQATINSMQKQEIVVKESLKRRFEDLR